jgi:hypothetical protein
MVGVEPSSGSSVLRGVLGWTIFDRLYILNGTVYVVSDDPEKPPVRYNMTSNGGKIEGGIPGEPTDWDMRITATKEAKYLFGSGASIIDGVTVRHLRFLS